MDINGFHRNYFQASLESDVVHQDVDTGPCVDHNGSIRI